jgi:hypothetical protein
MVAAEAQSIGFGGISIVARATGITRDTIRRGVEELQGTVGSETGRTGRIPERVSEKVSEDSRRRRA